MSRPDFVGFPSIARLTRECVVSEKIDGTNAQVVVTQDGEVFAGSRTRWITPEEDNAGFAKWVKTHEDELRTGLGIGQHFGEWYGQGIQRGYGLTEKRFALFNTSRWTDDVRPACCHVVPTLYSGPFETSMIDGVLLMLGVTGSHASPGFLHPEGIVIYHVASRQLFKKTLDGNDGHKTVKISV